MIEQRLTEIFEMMAVPFSLMLLMVLPPIMYKIIRNMFELSSYTPVKKDKDVDKELKRLIAESDYSTGQVYKVEKTVGKTNLKKVGQVDSYSHLPSIHDISSYDYSSDSSYDYSSDSSNCD